MEGSVVRVDSGCVVGIEAIRVEVEVSCQPGRFETRVVGLPDAAVRESLHRIRAAFQSLGLEWPQGRTTINLAPADLRKEGPGFDLPIALGLLAATDQLPKERLRGLWATGELALCGRLRAVRGVLPMALEAVRQGACGFLFPEGNTSEAALVGNLTLYPFEEMGGVLLALSGRTPFPKARCSPAPSAGKPRAAADFSEVKGQEFAKRAIEVAVAGGHNLLLVGPPGTGKSMLAQRIPTIFPPLALEEKLELTKIYSVAGLLDASEGLFSERPFRAPHHSISQAGLVGGGNPPRPGEVTLAHCGVLFLDELPEFSRQALESLRQPLEEGKIRIVRSGSAVTFPAGFMLVAAMNPTPTGQFDDVRTGRCTLAAARRYGRRLSGPLLDRMDLHVEVHPLGAAALLREEQNESSEKIARRVQQARERQKERFGSGGLLSVNACMGPAAIRKHCRLDSVARKLLEDAIQRLGLSARAYDRVLKVARTIADLEEAEALQAEHVAEAIQYRSLDRRWASQWIGA